MNEANRAKECLIADIALNRYIPFEFTVKEFFDYWLYYYKIEKKDISYHTYKSYHNILYNYMIPSLGAKTKLNNITINDLSDFINSIPYESVQDQALGLVRNIFRYACRNHFISYDPSINLYEVVGKHPDKRKKRNILCPVDKITQLLYVAKTDFPDLYIPLLLSVTLGTRISETIGIQYSDIDFTARVVYINKQLGRSLKEDDSEFLLSSQVPTKTLNGIRRIPVPDWVCDEIILCHAIYEHNKKNLPVFYDTGYVCCHCNGSPLHRGSVTRDFKTLLAVTETPDMHWHDLRHIYATTLKNNSVNMKAISSYLGHASPAFTEDVYISHTEEYIYDCTIMEEEWNSLRPKNETNEPAMEYIPFDSEDLKSLLDNTI